VSPRTRRVVLPTVEPIIVVAGSPPLHDPRWIYEPKFDGFRGVLYIYRGDCYIRSKLNNVLRRFADLSLRVAAELHARDAVLDGEVVALDDEGRMDFRPCLPARAGCTTPRLTCCGSTAGTCETSRSSSESAGSSSLSHPVTPRSSRVLAVEETGASCLRRPSAWTLRVSWPSGRQTSTRRRQPGTDQKPRLHPSGGKRGPLP
jgi:hypothetical protein